MKASLAILLCVAAAAMVPAGCSASGDPYGCPWAKALAEMPEPECPLAKALEGMEEPECPLAKALEGMKEPECPLEKMIAEMKVPECLCCPEPTGGSPHTAGARPSAAP